ncbi:MAG: hypothetical protein ACRC9U_02230 [Metamycoplasmataceae bacterium]
MNKKLLISLSSLATIAIVAPVLVITSCAGETPATVNLTITTKTDPKLTESNITALEGSELPAQLTALQKLFDGKDLSSANQDKFTVSIDKDKKTVTLTPKSGYTIDGKNTLTSNPYTLDTNPTITDLKITAKTAPEITQEDVTALKGNDLPTQLIVLNKLFSGADLISTNQNNFKVSIDEAKEIVTLTANSDFTINGEKTLNSNKYKILPTVEAENLTITAIANVVLTNAEVTTLEGSDANAKWTIYAKLFGGKDFLSGNIGNKFNVTFSKSDLEVTLTATIGFTIGGNPTLSNKFTVEGSVMPTDLAISAISGTPTITETELDNLTGTDNNNKLTALQKLFTGNGLTIENFGNFDVSIDKQAKIVTLNAKPNYTIAGSTSLKSSVYTLDTTPPVDKNLVITKKADPTLTATDVSVLEGSDIPAKFPVLEKLFEGEGLILANQDKFAISIDTNKKTVTLTANTGYTINNAGTLESNVYTIQVTTISLDITVIQTATSLTETEVANLEGSNADNKLAALKKLFTGNDLTIAHLANFDVTVDKSTTIVTLTAKSGFTIGGQASLKSTPYKLIINLDITKKANPSLTYTDIANLDGSNSNVNDATKFAILNKVFEGNGLIIDNLNKFTIAINKNSRTVTLNARQGNTIAGANSIPSNSYTINLNIRVKSGNIIIDQTDINNLNSSFANTAKLTSLQKFFDGSDLTTTRLADFNISVNTSTRKVTLNPKSTFIIDGKASLESNEYNNNLVIAARSGTINLSQTELLNLDWDDQAKKLETLKKIFEGNDLTLGNLNNFNIKIIRISANARVDLIVKTGYTFSGQQTRTKQVNLPSTPINANISPKNGAASLSTNEENILKQPTTSTNINAQMDILRNLFDGISNTNQRFFTISIDTTPGPGERTVTLTAKPGYVFGTSSSSTTQSIVKKYN